MEEHFSIETERLLLRKIVPTDAPFFFGLFNSKGWLKYIGDRNIKTVADAEKQLLEKYIPSYQTNGFGSYMVLEKVTGAAIGTCGIYKRERLDYPDIGFAFMPAYFKRGYGYEAAKAVLDYANDILNLPTILAFTVKENTASIKLLEKLGLKQTGVYNDNGQQEDLLLFATP